MESPSKRVKIAREEVIDRFLANVDVWQVIFERLPVKDRIRLEMTNKRLSTLMFACWKGVTSFDAECVTEMSDNPSMSKHHWAAVVAICASRIGDGLRSLTIREKFPIGFWDDSFRAVGEGCPNVETINFVIEGEGWRFIEDGGETLDIHLDLFSRLKTLTASEDSVGSHIYASASLFLSIPASIEVIRGLGGIGRGTFENAAQIEGFFADRPSLREISLGRLDTRDESKADIFRVIAQRCPHLKSVELRYGDIYINHRGVVALESMKELRIPDVAVDEMEIVTICERSPLVEVLELGLSFSSNLDLQSAALNALGALSKVRELWLAPHDGDMVAPSLMTEFVRELARNSGPLLQRLDLPCEMPLPTAAIEALANGCAKLRSVHFYACDDEVTPASIRFLIDCIVADPSWTLQTGERTLFMDIDVLCDDGYDDEAEAGVAAFQALADPAANLPAGVELCINCY